MQSLPIQAPSYFTHCFPIDSFVSLVFRFYVFSENNCIMLCEPVVVLFEYQWGRDTLLVVDLQQVFDKLTCLQWVVVLLAVERVVQRRLLSLVVLMRQVHLILQVGSLRVSTLINHVVDLFKVVTVAEAIRNPSLVVRNLALVLLHLQQVALREWASERHRHILLGRCVSLTALGGRVWNVVTLLSVAIILVPKVRMLALREINLATIDTSE